MAYKTIGSVLKSKNAGEPDYIKINEDVVLKKGECLSLSNVASKIKFIQKGLEEGRISSEEAEKRIAQAEKQPDFVRFEISKKD